MKNLILGTLAMVMMAGAAQAEPMDSKEFHMLVSGHYSITQPVVEAQFGFEPGVRIFRENGEFYLENGIFAGTKTHPARYRVSRFECFKHFPESTSCGFNLELVDMGSYVHFLGVNPNVNVVRRGSAVTLEIRADYVRVGERPEQTILEKL